LLGIIKVPGGASLAFSLTAPVLARSVLVGVAGGTFSGRPPIVVFGDVEVSGGAASAAFYSAPPVSVYGVIAGLLSASEAVLSGAAPIASATLHVERSPTSAVAVFRSHAPDSVIDNPNRVCTPGPAEVVLFGQAPIATAPEIGNLPHSLEERPPRDWRGEGVPSGKKRRMQELAKAEEEFLLMLAAEIIACELD
jgi:hypothetical protein